MVPRELQATVPAPSLCVASQGRRLRGRPGGERLRSVVRRPTVDRDTSGPPRVRTSDKREFSESMYRSTGAYELVFSPLLLALIGLGLDRLLGTFPIFTISFAVLGLVGVVIKIVYQYRAEMDELERTSPWAKSR